MGKRTIQEIVGERFWYIWVKRSAEYETRRKRSEVATNGLESA